MTVMNQWTRIKATEAKQREITELGHKITHLVHLIYAAYKEQYDASTVAPYEAQLKELSRKQTQLATELEKEYQDIQQCYADR